MVAATDIMGKLTERQQEAFRGRYCDGLTSNQTADRMRINPRRERQLIAVVRRRFLELGIKLPQIKRGRRAGYAIPASQLGRNRASAGIDLETICDN